ncbi:hypothetical protein FRACYDRAFT_240605 [Fragilariopsis cylindrus CCMP1102]|uniref:Sulfotransferase domain-containing protein n=1 Tax=Fragilariopsis cylindrus CCMP1102 TaxID=635003 RepID=A0A1E7FCM2_9STRA|nr:hypothetical protein FRACYDRAFT_240605 [Fragilariopsis cylindrus CCMP1102]|eukprot:OEU15910.1 hypothetical protein FRACYDRAFT_240605 [Fragilariopsis cylindrus CCMP1102]
MSLRDATKHMRVTTVTPTSSAATLQQFNNNDDDCNKRGIDDCLQIIIPRKLCTTPSFVRCLLVSLSFFVIWFQIFIQQSSASSSSSSLYYSNGPQQQSQQQPIIRNLNRGNNSTDDSIKGIEPIILPLENRSKHHLFVHIGKAGGSSIWVMSYSKYTQFFINVRDPIDRLISWYNYETSSFKREPRWTTANETGQASDNFRRLSQVCFPGKNGFTNMVNGGLLLSSSSSSSSNNNESTDCNELARLCLRGDIMCFGHNYYNYEVYLEEILLRKGFSTATATTTTISTKKNNNDNTISTENNNDNNIDSNIRIDVLRSEHSMDDFNRTVGLWTINTSNNNNENDKIKEFVGITDFVQGLYGRVRTIQQYDNGKSKFGKLTTKKNNNNNNDDDGILSSEASAALCKHICTELIVYKLILKASNNLYGSEIRDSYNALDQRCGFIVDDVCGTTWTYRDIKTKKNVFEAPW